MKELPSQTQLTWPVVQALRTLGGSGAIGEIDSQVIEDCAFNEDEQSILHGDGPRTELQYRLAWSRNYLKNAGLLENSRRGIWVLTELGKSATQEEMERLIADWRRKTSKPSTNEPEPGATLAVKPEPPMHYSTGVETAIHDDDYSVKTDWKEELLDELQKLDGHEFEHLARRLLREEGFVNTGVTQKSRDGGIDGVGTFRISLISFRVFFQCKRYAGSVRASHVRDFRGAMHGRGDKGLLITTGTFTTEAQKEAVREGATPIELIDGDRLCDLLRERGLGVKTREEVHEIVSVDHEFFAAFH